MSFSHWLVVENSDFRLKRWITGMFPDSAALRWECHWIKMGWTCTIHALEIKTKKLSMWTMWTTVLGDLNLVGGLEHILFFHTLGIVNSNPNWLIFFRGVETTNHTFIYMDLLLCLAVQCETLKIARLWFQDVACMLYLANGCWLH